MVLLIIYVVDSKARIYDPWVVSHTLGLLVKRNPPDAECCRTILSPLSVAKGLSCIQLIGDTAYTVTPRQR